jgi:hypothetical protein
MIYLIEMLKDRSSRREIEWVAARRHARKKGRMLNRRDEAALSLACAPRSTFVGY